MEFYNLKKCMDDLVSRHNTPGVDCMVCRDHEKIFRYFTGVSDIENNKAMKGDELYFIFSMTKMLTCTAALQLFEQGKFQMNDCISKYLPEFSKMKISFDELDTAAAARIASGGTMGEAVNNGSDGYAKTPITVWHLFTMSAGLDYDVNSEGIKNALAKGRASTRDLVAAMAQKTLGFEPGTRFRYSLCHDVLGALVEVWSGKKLGEYMKENIFAPLGMNNTFFGLPKNEGQLSKMAARYTFNENKIPQRLNLTNDYNITAEYESGGAGLTSCTQDYALFLDALACGGVGKNGNRILSQSSVEAMGCNQLNGRASQDFYELRKGYGYGLGVRVHIDKSKSGSLSPIGEFGWDGSAGAFSMVDTKNRISLTYFQHVHNWDLQIQNNIRNALYQDISAQS